MFQSFSMGVRQRGDVRRQFELISSSLRVAERVTREPTGSESMKVLAYNLQTSREDPSRSLPRLESVRDRCVAGRVGCEDSSPDAPHVLAFSFVETTYGKLMFYWTVISTIILFSLWIFGIIGG